MRAGISAFVQRHDQLPAALPVFPLPGVILLPGAYLPLNIFERRYLNMVEDALQDSRLIGMLQPRDDDDPGGLYDVGCAGRITDYRETPDSRLEIVLTGVCRFDVMQELPTVRGYRMVQPDWDPYAGDHEEDAVDVRLRDTFTDNLQGYLETREISLDWERMQKLPAETLVSHLAMALPLPAEDKQLLLEAGDLTQRIRLFAAILDTPQRAGTTQH